MTQVYHQLGFRYQWSLDSLANDGTGDGVILGPRYMERSVVEALPSATRERAIFDPQFFLPGDRKAALASYDFFPDVVANGFESREWTPDHARATAQGCLEFQHALGFRYATIPTRNRDGAPSDFVDNQSILFVEPFLDAYISSGGRQPLLLQLVITDQMIRDIAFRNTLLSWVTGIESISGVYLIYQVQNRHKQLDDTEILIGLLTIIHALRQNAMDVVLGYQNTEALLLLAAEPTIAATGCYENLRMFSLAAFVDEDPQQRRGPNARLYVSRLCQWIDNRYIGAIRSAVDDPDSYFDETPYRADMFNPSYNWHFARPQPYMHYFFTFSRQLAAHATGTAADRVRAIRATLERAHREHQELRDRGVVLDSDSDGSHLPTWLSALNVFARQAGIE